MRKNAFDGVVDVWFVVVVVVRRREENNGGWTGLNENAYSDS